MKLINSREALREFAAEHGLRPDWHEPDEQEVTAVVKGTDFDNAGFWPRSRSLTTVEKHVILKVDGAPVAAVNLATLFAWASESAS